MAPAKTTRGICATTHMAMIRKELDIRIKYCCYAWLKRTTGMIEIKRLALGNLTNTVNNNINK